MYDSFSEVGSPVHYIRRCPAQGTAGLSAHWGSLLSTRPLMPDWSVAGSRHEWEQSPLSPQSPVRRAAKHTQRAESVGMQLSKAVGLEKPKGHQLAEKIAT